MGIRPTFKQTEVKAKIDNYIQDVNTRIEKELTRLGELCIIEMRTNREYIDRTGNLLASTGYVVAKGGVIKRSAGFSKERDTATAGKSEGLGLAKEVMGEYPQGWVLIVVAGMKYAAHVEALGKNVLSSAELVAEKEVRKILKRL
jgi:hypothetical protein